MTPRLLLITHVLVAVIGTAAFWWLVMPAHPLEATADGITAAAVAGYVEIIAMRIGG
jgi:hypothetical protein